MTNSFTCFVAEHSNCRMLLLSTVLTYQREVVSCNQFIVYIIIIMVDAFFHPDVRWLLDSLL